MLTDIYPFTKTEQGQIVNTQRQENLKHAHPYRALRNPPANP